MPVVVEDRLPGGRAAAVEDARSSGSISIRSSECGRGTTSAWPGVAGLMSMIETVRSSESIVWLGIEPSTIPQKRQSATWRTLVTSLRPDQDERPDGETCGPLALTEPLGPATTGPSRAQLTVSAVCAVALRQLNFLAFFL